MKLQTIFDHLKANEFSQLSFGAGPGVIDDTNLDIMISHVNLGLTDLFTRFELKVSRAIVLLQEGLTTYQLSSKSAVNGRGAKAPLFIEDSASIPFKDDVVLISRVYTDQDYELPLNRLDVAYSLLTSAIDRIEVPLSIVNKSVGVPLQLQTDRITVIYRANHPILNPNIGAFDPERLDIELPNSHLTALLYFMASRAHNPVGLQNEFNAGNTYAAKYEAECARLKNDGMEIQQRGGEDKFYARGFV